VAGSDAFYYTASYSAPKEFSMEIATIAQTLSPLALLACPVGMGLMMWVMGRQAKAGRATDSAPDERPPSIELLREEQRRLDAEITRLEQHESERTEQR
jgi:hypothetical protein